MRLPVPGQNLVGLKSAEIKTYMTENQKDMIPENVINDKYSYLKYTDNYSSRTLLFFLDKDSVCKSIRMICELTARKDKINELNGIYEKKGENRWVDSSNGKDVIIELKDDKWSFTISYEPLNKAESGSN